MNKPIGGRGKKAPYESTHVRVPLPIKSEVEMLIAQFREGGNEETEQNSLASLEEALQIAGFILKQKKGAKISLEKLLTSIYKVPVTL